MSQHSFVRRASLAGALALSLAGLAAAPAQAMPVASTLSQGAAGTVTTVQYMMHRRHRYSRYNRAGMYNCGRNALHTHLERTACGSMGPGHSRYYR